MHFMNFMYPFCAYQNNVRQNFAVVMSAFIKRVDSISNSENSEYSIIGSLFQVLIKSLLI